MKVLSITDLCLGYSANLSEIELYRGLVSRGVQLTVIAHWKTVASEDLEASGIRVIYLPILKKIDLKVVRQLRELIKKEKYDILHLTYGKAITNSLIASRGINVKIVAFLGSLSLHWHDPFTYLSFLNRRIDKLICCSEGVEEHVLRESPRRMKNKTIPIHLGYDPEWLDSIIPAERKKLGIPDTAFVVCSVANIRKVKGIKFLARSSDFLPEGLPIWFLLVGNKSDSPQMKKIISATKYADNFITVGFSKDPNSYVSICDLYIQPSLSEGLGRSIIEAMCLGKPAIVTSKGGSKELISEGIDGYVIPPGSSEAIAEKINYCYQRRERVREMGEKAREKIANDFSSRVMIDKTFDLFKSLLLQNSD